MSGKTMIILALGFSIITSFLILKLNANSKEGLTTTVDHFKSIQSRLIANSGAEIYLEISIAPCAPVMKAYYFFYIT